MKNLELFSFLSKKIFLSPSQNVLNDCEKFLETLEKSEDFIFFCSLDVSNFPIYRTVIDPISLEEFPDSFGDDVESPEILEKFSKSYEFANIKSQK